MQIKKALDNLNYHSENYYYWLIIGFCLKDLYDNSNKKYNKKENKNIFLNLEPKIDINYLFKLADIKY